MYFKNNLITGTYKLKYKLYDNDVYIGEIEKYIIIQWEVIMEENIELRTINNEELLAIYKTLIDFVKELEKEIEKTKQEDVLWMKS